MLTLKIYGLTIIQVVVMFEAFSEYSKHKSENEWSKENISTLIFGHYLPSISCCNEVQL